VFRIARTPAAVVALQGSGKIVNVNVKGKRGNIVQTYPATEYDFMPGRFNHARFCHNYLPCLCYLTLSRFISLFLTLPYQIARRDYLCYQTLILHSFFTLSGRVHVSPTDLLHVQWTGSNTHENNGGGDGQGGRCNRAQFGQSSLAFATKHSYFLLCFFCTK
jgi:hypothetical protein